jgi:regulator of protease activity HflC (stomatin/prohibitin superfamily)
MITSSKRPEHVAWLSLVLGVVFFAVAFFLARWSGFFAVSAISWLSLSVVLVWLVLAIHFHQRALAEQERLDISQLARDERAATIFQAEGERAAMFAAARRRLEILEKWFVPIFAAAIAIYEIAIGLYLLKTVPDTVQANQSQPFLLCAVCMTAVAFVSFLISRYATGMAAEPSWKPLRAGGSFLLGIAVLCFALAIALALANFQIFVVMRVLNFVVPTLLIVLGAETALNVVLDIYRPRLKGQYSRAAFDSRLLGTINEPGGIFRSAASAIDYQFGFKVSQTWFYKLLEKAIVPLVLFAAVTLYLLSCLVVVAPNEQAIIEHFGNPRNSAGQVRLAAPGLAFKWPWPIDKVRRYPAQKISELHIGYVPRTDPQTGRMMREEHLLWGVDHYKEEHSVLVATEYTGRAVSDEAVPVSLVKANIPVQYRVKDLYSYIYNYDDPQTLLEAICYRELTRFAASATIDVNDQDPNAAGHLASLFGSGREQAKQMLTSNIQNAADKAGLGVEIVFLGVQGVHPPVEVTADYQSVVGAVQKRQKVILEAQAERNKNLSTLAGSVSDANELYRLAEDYRQAETKGTPQDVNELAARLDRAFAEAGGDISIKLRESQSYAYEKVTLARATGLRFADQLKAYTAAKDIYRREQRLRVFEEALKNIRKYVVVADPNDKLIFIVNFEEKLIPSLYDITGAAGSSEK